MEIKKTYLKQDIIRLTVGNELSKNNEVFGDIELDTEISDIFINTIMGLIEKKDFGIILDLSNVTYIDSTGLWAIFELHKKLTQINKNMCVVNAQKDVARVLEITKMDQRVPVLSSDHDSINLIRSLKGAENENME